MSSAKLPREILKWLQSLDLTSPVKSAKWDLSNGFLIAEICSRYVRQDIDMHMFHNATVIHLKYCNWALLKKVFDKNGLDVSEALIEATIHCKNNAAVILLCNLYEQLTNKRLQVNMNNSSSFILQTMNESRDQKREQEDLFTDHIYQLSLPLHCRATALQTVRNNFCLTEMLTYHDLEATRKKAKGLMETHSNDREKERLDYPQRFNHQSTIGELAPRQSPSSQSITSMKDGNNSAIDEKENKCTDDSGRQALNALKNTNIKNSLSSSVVNILSVEREQNQEEGKEKKDKNKTTSRSRLHLPTKDDENKIQENERKEDNEDDQKVFPLTSNY